MPRPRQEPQPFGCKFDAHELCHHVSSYCLTSLFLVPVQVQFLTSTSMDYWSGLLYRQEPFPGTCACVKGLNV